MNVNQSRLYNLVPYQDHQVQVAKIVSAYCKYIRKLTISAQLQHQE
jgi:hypothetical protein